LIKVLDILGLHIMGLDILGTTAGARVSVRPANVIER